MEGLDWNLRLLKLFEYSFSDELFLIFNLIFLYFNVLKRKIIIKAIVKILQKIGYEAKVFQTKISLGGV